MEAQGLGCDLGNTRQLTLCRVEVIPTALGERGIVPDNVEKGRDGFKRIVDFMCDRRRKATDRGQFFRL